MANPSSTESQCGNSEVNLSRNAVCFYVSLTPLFPEVWKLPYSPFQAQLALLVGWSLSTNIDLSGEKEK